LVETRDEERENDPHVSGPGRTMGKAPLSAGDKDSEARRLDEEFALRRREVEAKEVEADVRDREQRLKNRELRLKIIELRKSRYTNPLFLALIGTSVTAISAVVSAWWASQNQAEIERFKADSTLILQLTNTAGDEKKARDNLAFLVDSKLITDVPRREEIKLYLDSKKPVPSGAQSSAQGFGATCTMARDFDLPQIVEDMEKSLRANQTISGVEVAKSANLASLAVAFAVPNVGFACPGTGPRAGRVIITMLKTNRTLRIDFDVPIPRLLWAAFSPGVTSDLVASLTKMLEGKLDPGSVKCA
jgi:hypothetical protein